MKKKVFGRHFKRDANERKALFKGLLSSLIMEERIQTTEAKAKAIRSRADKLVTRAKKGGTNLKGQLQEYLRADAIEKLVKEIAPRFTNRQGGYTRILRTSRRVADNAQMALMEWTEQGKEVKQSSTVTKTKKQTTEQTVEAVAPVATPTAQDKKETTQKKAKSSPRSKTTKKEPKTK